MINDMALRLSVAAFEGIFIFVFLAALLHQRNKIGDFAFGMSFCAVLFFGCIAAAADLKLPWPGGVETDFRQTVIQIPLMTLFLLTFISCGVLKSQQLLIGAVCAYLLFIFFSASVNLQCSFLPEDNIRAVIFLLLSKVKDSVNVNAVCNLLAFFTVPMFYSAFPRWKFRFFQIALALTCAQTVALIPVMILKNINGEKLLMFHPVNAIALISILIMALLLSIYLRLLGKELPMHKSGVFDFMFAFFGSYSRVMELEEDLSRWENRYHLVLQHTADAVVICDVTGKITEANIAAGKIFANGNADILIGKELYSLFTPDIPLTPELAVLKPQYFNCSVKSGDTEKYLSASITPVHLKKQLLMVMVARDFTAERVLAEEKEQLTEQLINSQRMESLGVLAGGIAHDFNNYIHAILGHADVAMMISGDDREKVESHLRKITSIAEKAGKLTSQLLGFARKGKYHIVEIDIKELLEDCTGLLEPLRLQDISLRSKELKHVTIHGDQLQMQQVVMNLLINALDAVENAPDKIISLSSGSAVSAPLPFNPPPDRSDAHADGFIYFAIRDNGNGMSEETKRKIFEPFFTTKPVGQGTGMGLAMVYGTVTHHKGWIELESDPEHGTCFCVFLPGHTV